MEQIILSLISQLNSSIFILLGIFVLSLIAVYKLGSWKQIFEHHKHRIGNEDVMSVYGILLRNRILNDKNIPISDVDKHAT